jgi:ferredoxin
MSAPARARDVAELVLDPILCAGHGLCAELMPERIVLDDWGYPMVDPSVPDDLHEHAVRAVKACPVMALKLRRRSPGR